MLARCNAGHLHIDRQLCVSVSERLKCFLFFVLFCSGNSCCPSLNATLTSAGLVACIKTVTWSCFSSAPYFNIYISIDVDSGIISYPRKQMIFI